MDIFNASLDYVEEVKDSSPKERIKAMDHMVRSAWVLLPCMHTDCKKCMCKNMCDQFLALMLTISTAREEFESC